MLGDTIGLCPVVSLFGGNFMRPVKRSGVHKGSSAGHFKSQIKRSKAPNVVHAPMRGGWRL